MITAACHRGTPKTSASPTAQPTTTTEATASASSDAEGPAASATATPAPDQPGVEINFPADGETVQELFLSITVRSFQLTTDFGKPKVAGQGHVVYYLDQSKIPTTQGKPALTEDGRSHRTEHTSYKWAHSTPGPHTLQVQLVNNDDSPLSPPVTDDVSVNVQ